MNNFTLDNPIFGNAVEDINEVLEQVLMSMLERGAEESTVNIKLDIRRQAAMNGIQEVSRLLVTHKVSSRMTFDNSISGEADDMYEVVNDDGELEVRRIKSNQTSMFD